MFHPVQPTSVTNFTGCRVVVVSPFSCLRMRAVCCHAAMRVGGQRSTIDQ